MGLFTKKNANSFINYSPSCRSKPLRLLFIFGIQMKVFLMKSESFLSLHWQLRNYHFDSKTNPYE